MDTSKESIAYSKTKIKICGLSRETDIAWANELSPDYIGFVFAKKAAAMSARKRPDS